MILKISSLTASLPQRKPATVSCVKPPRNIIPVATIKIYNCFFSTQIGTDYIRYFGSCILISIMNMKPHDSGTSKSLCF